VPELARSFGRIAAEYDAVRPDYAPAALARAEEVLGLGPAARVVDLAAGSGKLTRALAARFAEVVAVEPDEEMRAILGGRSPEIELVHGTAEDLPLADAVADAVFVGDAFHWFDAARAVAELERVIRPGGGLALLWNHWWSEGPEGTADALEPQLPAAARMLLDAVYAASGRAAARASMPDPLTVFADSCFQTLAEESFSRNEALTGAAVADLYATVSSIASLVPDDRSALRRELLRLLDERYRLTITTVLHWTRRV